MRFPYSTLTLFMGCWDNELSFSDSNDLVICFSFIEHHQIRRDCYA
jgi:hypothetical protein